ncbi:uncharacterized protein LOC112680956 [Sipha flava]|uniref:Uncharacterized protein LOC112680956 n=1 Tax=Sipha flava TaxID=143950 RepID=A0A8B8F826_9HEMI|nr:uncharacterized protein LOC112680956 [Sipha flava]
MVKIKDDTRQVHFCALLKYGTKGDNFLLTVLVDPDKRNKCISQVIKNKIIQLCNTILQQKIINKFNKLKCFLVFGVETTDISIKEQFSICVHYIDEKNILYDDFLVFFTFKV